MKLQCCAVLVCLMATVSSAQRYKANVDPETREGLLIQQIQQESDPASKLKMLDQFATQYPKSDSILWALEQLGPSYLQARNYDKALAAGERLLAADANDLDASEVCLRASEGRKDREGIIKYSQKTWELASKVANAPKPADPAEAADWKKQGDFAKDLMAYSEGLLANAIQQVTDKTHKAELLKTLQTWNPKNQYTTVVNVQNEQIEQYKKTGNVALLEKASASDPTNEDILINIAEHYFRAGGNPDKVVLYAQKTIDLLQTKKKPASVSEDEWNTKRTSYLRQSYYLAGMVSSTQGRYSQADKYLRSALPFLRGSDQMMSAALYHLGYANYKLAEVPGERNRIFDALNFAKQCVAGRGPFADQAAKNVQAIKSEYNLQ